MNTQKPSKRNTGPLLEVHSWFNTIQGEGPNAGRPATFIRLGGCNLQCRFCDTEYTNGVGIYQAKELYEEVAGKLLPTVVITGGEPFRQPIGLEALIKLLAPVSFHIDIETNGTYEVPDSLQETIYEHQVNIICSPKTGTARDYYLGIATAFKILMSTPVDPFDLWPHRVLGGQCKAALGAVSYTTAIKDYLYSASRARPVYVQPEDFDGINGRESRENQRAAVNFVMRYPQFILGSQLHKMHDLP